MKIPVTQALADKVGFPSPLNTIFQRDRVGIVGGSRSQPGVSVKNHCTGWEPWHSRQMKVNKGRQNSEITNLPSSERMEQWTHGVDMVQFHHVSQESEEREILNVLIIKKKYNDVIEWRCQLMLWWSSFYDIEVYQINTLYILNFHDVICQLYSIKLEKVK